MFCTGLFPEPLNKDVEAYPIPCGKCTRKVGGGTRKPRDVLVFKLYEDIKPFLGVARNRKNLSDSGGIHHRLKEEAVGA